MVSTRREHTAWTAMAADAQARTAVASVRTALAGVARRHSVDVFLQGSYANTTNVRDDDDVDIVVRSEVGDVREVVTAALIECFGADAVHQRDKCVTVDGRPGSARANIVPCVQHVATRGPKSDDIIEGIAIEPRRSKRVVSFPLEHISNGHRKNAACTGRYKETVRQVKRLFDRVVEQRVLSRSVATGFLLECMTFNAPAGRFVPDDSERLRSVVLWLKTTEKSHFRSCDGIHRLFQTDPGQFDIATAQTIADALWQAL